MYALELGDVVAPGENLGRLRGHSSGGKEGEVTAAVGMDAVGESNTPGGAAAAGAGISFGFSPTKGIE